MPIKFIKALKSKIKRIKLSPKRIEKNQNKICAAKKIKKLYKRTSSIKTTNGSRIIKYDFNQSCVGKIKPFHNWHYIKKLIKITILILMPIIVPVVVNFDTNFKMTKKAANSPGNWWMFFGKKIRQPDAHIGSWSDDMERNIKITNFKNIRIWKINVIVRKCSKIVIKNQFITYLSKK